MSWLTWNIWKVKWWRGLVRQCQCQNPLINHSNLLKRSSHLRLSLYLVRLNHSKNQLRRNRYYNNSLINNNNNNQLTNNNNNQLNNNNNLNNLYKIYNNHHLNKNQKWTSSVEFLSLNQPLLLVNSKNYLSHLKVSSAIWLLEAFSAKTWKGKQKNRRKYRRT